LKINREKNVHFICSALLVRFSDLSLPSYVEAVCDIMGKKRNGNAFEAKHIFLAPLELDIFK